MSSATYEERLAHEKALGVFEENAKLIIEITQRFMRERMPLLEEAGRNFDKNEIRRPPNGTEFGLVDYKLVVLTLAKECLEEIYRKRNPGKPLPSLYSLEYVALREYLTRYFYSQFRQEIQSQLD